MPREPITHSLTRTFTWSFLIAIGCFVGVIILALAGARRSATMQGLAMALAPVMMIAGLVWYISLGIVADRLGRRWIVWVGLSFLTAPIGPIIAYVLMLDHIKAASTPQAEIVAP